MINKFTSLVLSALFCIFCLCGCGEGQIEVHHVFPSVYPDTRELLQEEEPVSLEMPPVVTFLEVSNTDITLVTGQSLDIEISVSPKEAWNKDILFESSNNNIATVDEGGKLIAVGEGKCTVRASSVEMSDVFAEILVRVMAPVAVKAPETKEPESEDNADGVEIDGSVQDLTYISGILIANKTYSLPADYNPGVDDTAYSALMQMFAAAKEEGISFWIASGFRSYDRQNRIYNNYVAQDGKAAADRYSARPGHSEHQTGLAFDLNYLTQAFGQSREGVWLAENCHKYGFIIRYPEGKEHITGYMYEPWHVRYIGVDTASAVYESGLCLEEFLGITSVYAEN